MRVIVNNDGKTEFVDVEKDYHVGTAYPNGIESNTNILKLEDDTICINTVVLKSHEILWHTESRYTKDSFLRLRELMNEIKFD